MLRDHRSNGRSFCEGHATRPSVQLQARLELAADAQAIDGVEIGRSTPRPGFEVAQIAADVDHGDPHSVMTREPATVEHR